MASLKLAAPDNLVSDFVIKVSDIMDSQDVNMLVLSIKKETVIHNT